MPIDNQIEPPQSFMAMYIKPGQKRPNAPQDVVLARYEQCEDMACVLTEHAQTLAFKENFSEAEVLTKCHKGLLNDASDFNENEARWVIQRLLVHVCQYAGLIHRNTPHRTQAAGRSVKLSFQLPLYPKLGAGTWSEYQKSVWGATFGTNNQWA